MDYQGRLATLRERMGVADIDLVYLKRGANLFYLTGIRRQLEHHTDHHAFAEWMTGAVIGREGGLVVFHPRMGGDFYVREAADKPWVDGVRFVNELDSPDAVLSRVIREVTQGEVRRVAVDDRAWSEAFVHLQEVLPDARFSLASDLITPMRTIKSAEEVAALRRASELADRVFGEVIPFLRIGVSAFEIAQDIERLFQRAGADHLSFQTGIYINGPAHGREDDIVRAKGSETLQPGQSLMFDFGCQLDDYCSDFGRTAYAGEPSAEYRKIHEIILASQAAAMQAMKAGQITTADANRIARQVIAEAGYDAGFTHRLGHGIGVTVHEPPFLDVMDQTVLRENMTFTVEPSIRLPDSWGNRVEDVVLVTQAGGVSLNHAPHELVIID